MILLNTHISLFHDPMIPLYHVTMTPCHCDTLRLGGDISCILRGEMLTCTNSYGRILASYGRSLIRNVPGKFLGW